MNHTSHSVKNGLGSGTAIQMRREREGGREGKRKVLLKGMKGIHSRAEVWGKGGKTMLEFRRIIEGICDKQVERNTLKEKRIKKGR